MFQYYFDLKNDDKLPLGAKFIDPYDNEEFVVEKEQTLPDFISKIQNSRVSKGQPKVQHDQMRVFVVSSLYETTNEKLRNIFFKQVKSSPEISQIIGVTKTMVNELVHGHKEIPGALRQKRALKCMGCKLHKPSGGWSASANRLIKNIVGLKDVKQSKEEQKLGTCGMCGCGLAKKVQFSAGASLNGVSPQNLDKLMMMYREKAFDTCWVLNETVRDEKWGIVLRKKLQKGIVNSEPFLDKYLEK